MRGRNSALEHSTSPLLLQSTHIHQTWHEIEFLPKGNTHRLCQPLAGMSHVFALPNPYLTHIFCINCRQGSMQGHLIQQPVHSGWKEYYSCSLPRLDLQTQSWKGRCSSLIDIIEIHQHSNSPLSAIRSKPSSIFIRQVERIKVLQVLLAGKVAPNLRKFAVFHWFTSQQSHLPHVVR